VWLSSAAADHPRQLLADSWQSMGKALSLHFAIPPASGLRGSLARAFSSPPTGSRAR